MSYPYDSPPRNPPPAPRPRLLSPPLSPPKHIHLHFHQDAAAAAQEPGQYSTHHQQTSSAQANSVAAVATNDGLNISIGKSAPPTATQKTPSLLLELIGKSPTKRVQETQDKTQGEASDAKSRNLSSHRRRSSATIGTAGVTANAHSNAFSRPLILPDSSQKQKPACKARSTAAQCSGGPSSGTAGACASASARRPRGVSPLSGLSQQYGAGATGPRGATPTPAQALVSASASASASLAGVARATARARERCTLIANARTSTSDLDEVLNSCVRHSDESPTTTRTAARQATSDERGKARDAASQSAQAAVSAEQQTSAYAHTSDAASQSPESHAPRPTQMNAARKADAKTTQAKRVSERIIQRLRSAQDAMLTSERLLSALSDDSRDTDSDYDGPTSATPLPPAPLPTPAVTRHSARASINPNSDLPAAKFIALVESVLNVNLAGDMDTPTIEVVRARLMAWKKMQDAALNLSKDSKKQDLRSEANDIARESETRTLRAQLTDAEIRISRLREENRRIKAEESARVSGEYRTGAIARDEVANLRNALTDREVEIAQLERRIEDLKASNLREISDRAALTRTLDELRSSHAREIEANSREKDNMLRESRQLRTTLNDLREENSSLRQKLKTAQDEIDAVVSSLANSKSAKKPHRRVVTISHEDGEDADNEEDSESAKAEEMRVLRHTLRKSRDELNIALQSRDAIIKSGDELRSKISNLAEELKSTRLSKEELENQVAALLNKVHNLKESARRSADQAATASRLLQDSERRIAELTREGNTVEAEKDGFAARAHSAESQLALCRAEVDKLNGILRSRESRLEDVTASMRVVESDLAKLRVENQALLGSRMQIDTERSKLKAELERFAAIKVSLEEELNDARLNMNNVMKQESAMRTGKENAEVSCKRQAERIEELTRDLAVARNTAESGTRQISVLEAQVKAAQQEAREASLRLSTAERRANERSAEISSLSARIQNDSTAHSQRLESALAHVQELDRQLVETKTALSLVSTERDRKADEIRQLQRKAEKSASKSAELRAASDDADARANELRLKLDSKSVECKRYKNLYENALLLSSSSGPSSNSNNNSSSSNSSGVNHGHSSSGLSMNERKSGSSNARKETSSAAQDELVLLLARLRKIIHTAARDAAVTSEVFSSGAGSLSTEAGSDETIATLDRLLQVLMAQNPRYSNLDSGANRSINLIASSTLGLLSELSNLRLLTSAEISDLENAAHKLGSTESMKNAPAVADFVAEADSKINKLATLLLTKYKTVILSVQERIERQLADVSKERESLKRSNEDMKNRLAHLSALIDRSEEIRQSDDAKRRVEDKRAAGVGK